MELKDYYKVLGVERSAPDANIKKAFCRLDCKHHPDVSKAPQAQAQARMQELNEANEVLRDVEKYSAYDQVGQRAQSGQDFQPLPGWNSGFEFNGPPGVFGDFGASGDHKAFFEALFSSAVVRPAQVATHDPASSHPCEEKIITPRSSCHWRISLTVPCVNWRCNTPSALPPSTWPCTSARCRSAFPKAFEPASKFA